MRAMVLETNAPIESSPLRLVEREVPEPGAGQVRIAVRCCAVCRTDLHVIEGELPAQKLPIVPGHQIVGRVDALGPGCTRSELGRRVGVAWLRHTCGSCDDCARGRENLCEASRYTGYHADGGYAEYALAPEDFVYEIPDVFDDVAAAPLLCAGIIGYRALRRCNLPRGGRLALFGFGSSAHVVMQIALHRGCEVYVVSRGASHRRLAAAMGAAWVGARVEEMPARCDSAISFAPVGSLVPVALRSLKKGGTLALAGIYMTPIPEMDYEHTVFYERDIHSVTSNTRDDGRALLAEAAEIPIRPHTTSFPLEAANEVLQRLKADRIDGTGVLVVER